MKTSMTCQERAIQHQTWLKVTLFNQDVKEIYFLKVDGWGTYICFWESKFCQIFQLKTWPDGLGSSVNSEEGMVSFCGDQFSYKRGRFMNDYLVLVFSDCTIKDVFLLKVRT